MTRDLKRYVTDNAARMEAWLQSHLDHVALVLVAIGFLVRARIAAASFLNPDEALFYLFANQTSFAEAYKVRLTDSHPPLLVLLLYFWRFLGNSEFILRLPSLLAGTAFSWVAFKWIGNVLGKTAGLIGLILLAFAPEMISLSAEVRPYALLLLFMASALYFLERAFTERSARMIVPFSLFLYLAILSHYSAVLFTLVVGLYSLLRIVSARIPTRIIAAWAASQAGAVVLYAFLYVTQILNLRKSTLAQVTMGGFLREHYFHFGEDNLLVFALERSFKIFRYVFSQPVGGGALFFLFLVGSALLLAKNKQLGPGKPSSRHLGVLLLLPFVIGCGAAIAGLFPYGGSRHTVFLAPFAVAGVSFLLAKLAGQRLWAGLMVAVMLMGTCNLYAVPPGQHINPKSQDRRLMSQAVGYIHQSIPPGALIFLDDQSKLLVLYYLCGPGIVQFDTSVPGFTQFRCDRYSVISTPLWMFTAENFPVQFEQMVKTFGLKPGDTVWMVVAGWGGNIGLWMPGLQPEFRCLAPEIFGENISVFRVVVNPAFLPTALTTSC